MKADTLNGWKAVEAVIRNRGLAAAASELAVSRAAVAAQVRGVEARLGLQLFHRRPSGLEPTETALRIAHRLTSAFGEIAAVQEELSDASHARRVSISVSAVFADTWLPKHLPDLRNELPELDLRIDSTPKVASLDTGEFDFAIRFMGEPEPSLASIDLFPGAYAPVCTPDFAARYGLNTKTTTLEGVPLIRLADLSTDPTRAEWPTWTSRTGIALGDDREAVVDYSHVVDGLGVARSGSGLVLGLLAGCFDAAANGDIVLPLGRRSVVFTDYSYRLIWRRDRRLTGFRRRFRDFVDLRARRDRDVAERIYGVGPQ